MKIVSRCFPAEHGNVLFPHVHIRIIPPVESDFFGGLLSEKFLQGTNIQNR